VEENLNPVLTIQALRAVLYGFGAVLIGQVLARRGYSPVEVGIVLTSLVLGMGISSLLVGAIGTRFSPRALYVGLLLVMGLSGLVFVISSWLPALVAAGLTGTISTDPNESGPITTVEQALIGRADKPASALPVRTLQRRGLPRRVGRGSGGGWRRVATANGSAAAIT
jgi:MFS family permease